MFSNTIIDPDALRPLLASLRLTEHTQPVLVQCSDGGNHARIRRTSLEWAEYGAAACLMGLSYQWITLEPDTDAFGVWLPQHYAVIVADASMHTHVISLGEQPALIPERERAAIATELRGLVGSALMRPGRLSCHDPIVIAAGPSETPGLVRAFAARGHLLRAVTPDQAGPLWGRADKVYIHHSALAATAAAGWPARADVTILAPMLTEQVRKFAKILHTDDLHEWPAAVHRLADGYVNHITMQNMIRAENHSSLRQRGVPPPPNYTSHHPGRP